MHPRHHIDCVQLGFHIPTLSPPFLPAGTPDPFNFVTLSIFLCLVFCSRLFVFFLICFHSPPEDVFPFLFEPSDRAIFFYWLRPSPHYPIFVRANGPFAFFSSSFVQTLPQENCRPLLFAPQLRCASPDPALGKKGVVITADSPCSCTAESRDCRARSSLHVGDRYPIDSRHSCSSTSARMNISSSLVFLSLPCRRWLYIKEEIFSHLHCNVHIRDHLWVLLN